MVRPRGPSGYGTNRPMLDPAVEQPATTHTLAVPLVLSQDGRIRAGYTVLAFRAAL